MSYFNKHYRYKFFISIFVFVGLVVLQISNVSAESSLNNYVISSYDIQYNLSRNEDGSSALKTIETITADFSVPNQNHGIERAIPESYDGHTVDLKIDSITDEQGTSLNYTTSSSNGNQILRIGEANQFVLGSKTYVISYNQRFVDKLFKNTGADEFYWDTNGDQWKVPISLLSVSLNIDGGLQDKLDGNTACYRGRHGSNDKCKLVTNSSSFTVQEENLGIEENVTISVGFRPATFERYQPSFSEKAINIIKRLQWLTAPVAIVAYGLFMWLYRRKLDRTSEINTIVPEFLPPKGVSVAISSLIVGSNATFSAQLIDFAVRHYIKIIETKPKKLWSQAEYDIEIAKDVTGLLAEEQEVLSDIFGRTPQVGERLALKTLRNNYSVSKRFADNTGKLQTLISDSYGIREKKPDLTKKLVTFGYIVLFFGVITVSIFGVVLAIIMLVYAYKAKPLTDRGLEIKKYLLGLKMYIKVAEEDRLRILQSPEGAIKAEGIDVNDPSKVVVLYERLLPYAMMFGQEKQWSKSLGKYYDDNSTSPDWYTGSSGFNSVVFISAMSNFNSSVSYSSPSSSSTGGSTGGGFSGGGGGGGGGGGW